MRILAGAVVCFLLGNAPVAAQDTVPLPVRIDGSARLVLNLTKIERRSGQPEQRAAFTYDVTMTGADKETGERGVVWHLTAMDGERVEPGASPSPDIRMTVDENLTPVSLDNLDEVMEAARRQLSASGQMDEAGARAFEGLLSLTPETAAPLFTRDATMLAQGQGTDLAPGEPSFYEIEGSLPWGGAKVTMIGDYELTEVDRTLGKAHVVWSQQIDPTSLREAMPQMIESLFAELGATDDSSDVAAKLRAAMTGATVENSRRCEFTVDIATGLAEKVDCLTTIAFVAGEESSRRETRLIATQDLKP